MDGVGWVDGMSKSKAPGTGISYFTNQPVEAAPVSFHQIHRMPYYGDDCIIIGFVTWSNKSPREITQSDFRALCSYYAGPYSCFNVTSAEIVTILPEGVIPLPNFRSVYLKLNLAAKPIQEEQEALNDHP